MGQISKNEKGKNSRFELIDGDVLTLDFERIEPLKSEILAFANWIIDGNKPLLIVKMVMK